MRRWGRGTGIRRANDGPSSYDSTRIVDKAAVARWPMPRHYYSKATSGLESGKSMKRALAFLALISGVLGSAPLAQARHPYSIELVEETSDSHHVFRRYHVRVLDIDLRFLLNSDIHRRNEGYVPSIESTPHLRVRNRIDLIAAIEEMLRHADERLAAGFTAWYLLPHIDDPRAAAVLVEYPNGVTFGVRWADDLPFPEDAADPPVWLRHVGNDLVLDKVENAIEELDEPHATPFFFYPVYFLAASDSPRAVSLLDTYLKMDPEWKASKLGALVDYDQYVSETTWRYIVRSIGEFCTRVTADWNGLCTMDFFDLRYNKEPEKYIAGFSWSVLDSLAVLYLDSLLDSSDFDRVMQAGVYQGNPPDSLSQQDMLNGFFSYEDVLSLCERHGQSRQIQLLQSALKRFEAVLYDPDLIRGAEGVILFNMGDRLHWPFGGGRALSGPGYDRAVKVYEEEKAAALKAMASRE
jgi:hypothetical protein